MLSDLEQQCKHTQVLHTAGREAVGKRLTVSCLALSRLTRLWAHSKAGLQMSGQSSRIQPSAVWGYRALQVWAQLSKLSPHPFWGAASPWSLRNVLYQLGGFWLNTLANSSSTYFLSMKDSQYFYQCWIRRDESMSSRGGEKKHKSRTDRAWSLSQILSAIRPLIYYLQDLFIKTLYFLLFQIYITNSSQYIWGYRNGGKKAKA